MKEFMIRLVMNNPDNTGNWEMKFKEQEQENGIRAGAHHLAIIGGSQAVAGAMLFELVPTGTVKEFQHIYSYLVDRNVVVINAHAVKVPEQHARNVLNGDV